MPNEAVPKFVTPVDSLRDFKTIALDMIKRGVHVSPARPGRRYSDLPDWQNKATLDPAQVDIWAAENPNYNCVSVAKAESVCILDIDDVKKAVAMGFPSYPGTLVVRTPRGGRHIYFKNPGLITGPLSPIKDEEGTIVEFKFHNVSVCSPGCTRDDGGKYEITSDHPIAELTPEIVEWLTTHSKARKQARDTRGLPVAEDFDFEDLMSFFDIEIARTNGIWHTPKGCPVKGDWHHTDNGSIDMGTCAFAWDPEARTLGWKDHAASCAGADMNVKQVIEFLEETKGVYPKEIFVELIDDAEVEWAELEDTETVDAESVFDANKCYILGCKCNKEHVVLPSMAGLLTEEIVSDETQAKIKANTAAAEEQERRTAKRMAEIEAIEASATQEEESDVPVASTPAASDGKHPLSFEEFSEFFSESAIKLGFVEAAELQEIPTEALYGKAGEWARELELPLSLAYPAILTAYSAMPHIGKILDTRFNLYCCLLMRVGGGKNLALDRATRRLGMWEEIDYMDASIGGAGGLRVALGSKTEGQGKNKVVTPGPRKMLLNPAEFGATMINCKIENSTLATHLSNLWDKDRISAPVREGKGDINCRLSILGALPVDADAPETFTKYFSEESAHGLYSRFLFGYYSGRLDHRWAERWHPKFEQEQQQDPEAMPGDPSDHKPYKVNTEPPKGWSAEAEQYFTELVLPYDLDGRGLYNLKRIALLTAMANGDTEVTLFCLKSAELFMLWQMHLKMFFKHGTAERTSPGELSNLILDTLRRIDQQGSYERSPVIDDRVQINLARVIRNNNWARFGIEAVERTIKSLIKTGQLKEGYRYNTKGKLVPSKHHTVYMRLRGDQAKN